jgi:hypothetical protein
LLQSPSTKERTLFVYFSKCERYYTLSKDRYPDSGGTVVVSTTYDSNGNVTSKLFTAFDAEGNIIEQVDLLAQQEALNVSSLTANRSLMISESLDKE